MACRLAPQFQTETCSRDKRPESTWSSWNCRDQQRSMTEPWLPAHQSSPTFGVIMTSMTTETFTTVSRQNVAETVVEIEIQRKLYLSYHVPEIGAENQYQKTGTIQWHENRACPIRYYKLIPEKIGKKLHVRRARNDIVQWLGYK